MYKEQPISLYCALSHIVGIYTLCNYCQNDKWECLHNDNFLRLSIKTTIIWICYKLELSNLVNVLGIVYFHCVREPWKQYRFLANP